MRHDIDFVCEGPAVFALPLRPRSLVMAAQAGQSGWMRRRDLPQLLRRASLPAPETALRLLLHDEQLQNRARLDSAPHYDMQRHVVLCIAILAECRLLTRLSAREKVIPERP